MFELTSTELDFVSGGDMRHASPRSHFFVDVDVSVRQDATATGTQTVTSGSITIENTHGPLAAGKDASVVIYTGAATGTQTVSATNSIG